MADATQLTRDLIDFSSGIRRYPQQMAPLVNLQYGGDNPELIALYEKAKRCQWDAAEVIDWAAVGGGHNPLGLPDSSFPLIRSAWFNDLRPEVRAEVIQHYQGWMVSQFLHGEQFGVLTASRIALEAPDHDSKLFAATQAVDEARHLESYVRLTDRIGVRYGLSDPFGRFLDDVISCSDLDIVYLGLQVIGEGIGLASFAQLRAHSTDPLIQTLYRRIMEDEARHVAFGRRFLRKVYGEMSSAERRRREDFVVEACGLMDERFRAFEVWARFGLDPKDAAAELRRSAAFKYYRKSLFKQIVPVIRDIGLWSAPTQAFFQSIGVAAYALSADVEAAE